MREREIITFGRYYKEDETTLYPLEWLVLSRENDRILLVTKDVIDHAIYAKSKQSYEASKIRKWLLNDFFNIAFNDEEKEMIIEAEVDNSPLSYSGFIDQFFSENTFDKVFLLSYKDMKDYFEPETFETTAMSVIVKNREALDRTANATNYAIKKGVMTLTSKPICCYWLRSPEPQRSKEAQYVKYDGTIGSTLTHTTSIGVRPAIYLKITK